MTMGIPDHLYEAVMDSLDDHMSKYITDMMRDDFEIDVSLIKDPLTGEVSLQNIDGSAVNEAQYYALIFFERGWLSALHAIGALAEEFDNVEEIGYTGENDTTSGEETE